MLGILSWYFYFYNFTAKDVPLISHKTWKLWTKCWHKITNDNVCMHIPSLTPRCKPIQGGSYLRSGRNESSSVKHGQFPWFFTKLSSCLFDNLFILIPYHSIITKERIKINVTRLLLSNSILSKDAVAWRHGNLMNENYQVGGLDLLWILLRNCDWFMV